jgi:hypothetical protein
LLGLSLALCLPWAPAQACGPDFARRLLSDRAQSLNELPESNFAFELSRIAPANSTRPRALTVDGEYSADRVEDNLERREQTEQNQLPAAPAQLIAQLRQLTDARQGAALSAELRLYTAGAVAFAQG